MFKTEKNTYSQKKGVNIYIIYGINSWVYTAATEFTLEYSLFRDVKLTKYIDPDNVDALDIVLNLIQEVVTCYLMVAVLVKMNQCSVLIWVHLYMLIIRKKYVQKCEKFQKTP